MKKSIFIFSCLGFLLIFSSCKTTFYQVYKTDTTIPTNKQDGKLVFEDVACKVIYNLWDEGGNVGFQLFNKTEENIYVDLAESFFILNGIAFDYYKDRMYSEGDISSLKQMYSGNNKRKDEAFIMSNGKTISISRKESRIICIPAKTSKVIFEYKVVDDIYRDCDMLLYPSKSKIKSLSFTRGNSPFVFSNQISYRVGECKNMVRMDHEFYVTQITNYPITEVTYYGYPGFCGEKSKRMQRYLQEGEPNEFYLKYKRIQGGWKH